jgi:hypothetical protein
MLVGANSLAHLLHIQAGRRYGAGASVEKRTKTRNAYAVCERRR